MRKTQQSVAGLLIREYVLERGAADVVVNALAHSIGRIVAVS